MKNFLLGTAIAASLMSVPAVAGNGDGYGVSTSAVAGDFGAFISVGSAYRMGGDSSGNYTVPTDTPPLSFNGCPAAVSNNPNLLCLGSAGGTADASYALTASTSSASIQTARLNDFANTNGFASASSYANLATGKVGASVQADFFRSGQAVAIFNDTLNFSIAGADPATVTQIGVTFAIDGNLTNSINAFSVAGVQGDLRFGDASATVSYQLASVLSQSLTSGGWLSGSWAEGSNPGQSIFTGVYGLIGSNPVVGIRSALAASASSVATSDYANTSTFRFMLPTNVSFTSNSGAFLSAPSGAVPEPAAWAMMIAGFGMIGVTMRRRSVIAEVAA